MYLRVFTTLFWTLGISICSFCEVCNGYCYNTEGSLYRLYSTKTRYDTVWNTKTRSHLNTSSIEGCEPSVFYFLARHGSRYPSVDDITVMAERLPEFQEILESSNSSLCDEDLAALKSWLMRMEKSNDMDLAETGWQELRDIAKRYSQSFPNLLAIPYDKAWFQFLHTERERTRDSAKAFAEGLFATYDDVEIEKLSKSNDWLLYFYKNCEKYQAMLDGNYEMYKAFKNGPEIEAVIKMIQNRTGLLMDANGEKKMENEDILENLYLLYGTCTFEYQVYNDSPWCALFTRENLEILEFGEDLKYYWVDGYGAEINYDQTCNLLKDIVYFLRLDENETPPTYKVLTRFAHSGALNMLFSELGLYKDEYELTANGYETSRDRKWRTSFHNPMSGNIAFVRYDCSPALEGKVVVYVNEELVTLPVAGCNNGICPVSALVEHWMPTTDTCDVHVICDLEVSVSTQLTSSVTVMMNTLLLSALAKLEA